MKRRQELLKRASGKNVDRCDAVKSRRTPFVIRSGYCHGSQLSALESTRRHLKRARQASNDFEAGARGVVRATPGAGLCAVDLPIGIYRRIPFAMFAVHKIVEDELCLEL